jgi:hypothetical protein
MGHPGIFGVKGVSGSGGAEFFGVLRFAQDDGKNEQQQRQRQIQGSFAALRMTAEAAV